MTSRNKQDSLIKQSLSKVKGLLHISSIRTEDRQEILHREEEAEKRSLMGMGKVSNVGVKKALQFDSIYLALTSIEFNWGHCSSLVLMKGDQLVGEDIYDEDAIAKLSKSPNAWFMHKNFVIYKDLISFPKDIMQKICHFEIPGTTVDWIADDKENGTRFEVWYGYPSTFCDVYLKEQYLKEYLKEGNLDGSEGKGLGTILIGVNCISDNGKEDDE